ncbi:hypothetical protein C5L38_09275 [Streptomyces sp. WAC00288]|uniref:hypothetical protein n=1 Tax=unclassified Streptomyces TaxID=2593676 RepID=UPI000788DFD1|nr:MULTISPECIES: hypothetical protein [unclassified Streptomyces]AVH95241.1 hypothetical protein C5L38_09275 [Streptomyces sp. WAC00288]KYG53935.1 hypothetical protein AWI43_05160 [Streptomyces sp. WAC04657]
MPKIHPLAVAMAENSTEFRQLVAEAAESALAEGAVAVLADYQAVALTDADRRAFMDATPGPHHFVLCPGSGGRAWLWPLDDDAWSAMFADVVAMDAAL